jgi:hypothetical protein
VKTVNRAAFIVRPKGPYLRWAASLEDEAPAAAETLRDRVSVYLVPEDPTGQEETAPLADYFETIFTYELEAWSLDEDLWPRERDLATFHRWFAVVGESVIVDLGDEPLRSEEL